MAHVLTFQKCNTIGEYLQMERVLHPRFVQGISEYADNCLDGAETIAEALGKMRNGYTIPLRAQFLLDQYLEVWKR